MQALEDRDGKDANDVDEDIEIEEEEMELECEQAQRMVDLTQQFNTRSRVRAVIAAEVEKLTTICSAPVLQS